MLDINLFWINQGKSEGGNLLPGLAVITAPRKAARGRELDTLIMLVAIAGAGGITAEGLNSWLYKKAELYFKTAGTVTLALRTFVDSLNSDLLQRNLKRAKSGERMDGAMHLAVLRRSSLYLVNIGAAHSWYVGAKESTEFSDTDNRGKGLGVNQKILCSFANREIAPNDLLIFSCQPPSGWKAENFAGCASLSNEAVSRRLFNQVGAEVQAAMVRFTEGKGMITQTPLAIRPAAAAPNPYIANDNPVTGVSEINSTPPLSQPVENQEAIGADQGIPTGQAGKPPAAVAPVAAKAGEPTAPDSSTPTGLKVEVGKTAQKVSDGVHSVGNRVRSLLTKFIPGVTEEPLKLSRNSLIAVAVAVPILIGLLAGAVYIKVGKSGQFNQYLVLAQNYAIQAEAYASDPPMRLASLQQSMYYLEKAGSYGESVEFTSLYLKVQGTLDDIEGIQRLDMVEVVPGGLQVGTNITQIVSTTTDLYLLDETSGTVTRLSMGSSGYEEDEAFECGPNPENVLNTMGKIIDIMPLNVNNAFKATLFTLDASGNIEFCIPGEAGISSSLVPPDQGWKRLTAATINEGYLYILDADGRAVYRYSGDGIRFESKPTLFFDDQIPDLTTAIDIEVNGDELYILRSDGQMVECTYGHLKDYKLTECIDPASYADMREGQTPAPISFPEANFIQMRMTGVPDSSIYLLDANAKALYHFSLQRNLQKVLHPRDTSGSDLDNLTPTAVAISSSRIVFMAFGNQIYQAQMP